MREYSLDLEAEKITSAKTKEYFKEVIKSYYNESYRSAIVMLYSVALCDMVLKLQALKDIYTDTNAIKILDAIEISQTENPNSPEWENKLVQMIKESTSFLESADYLNIQNLQKYRHLCAHPVITSNYELYSPNKETTRAFIRNTLEGLLTKPLLLSRKILDELLVDISQNKEVLSLDKDLERFLCTKYFNQINILVEKQIFKALWKITFRIDNPDCNSNRDINFRTIKILLKRHHASCLEEIDSDRAYYSKLDQVAINEIIYLLNLYPKVYSLLNDEAKLLIETEVNQDGDLKALAWFLSLDIKQHLDYLLHGKFASDFYRKKNYISIPTILHLAEMMEIEYGKVESNRVLIDFFGQSGSYDIADSRYQDLIKPNLDSFSLQELEVLRERMNSNSQIYGRRAAHIANSEVQSAIDFLSK